MKAKRVDCQLCKNFNIPDFDENSIDLISDIMSVKPSCKLGKRVMFRMPKIAYSQMAQDMRSKWFVRDEGMNNYRLKGHAKKDFYGWISSWACMLTKPSDLFHILQVIQLF